MAGEALPSALWQEWIEATGVPLYESLGMSEISTFVSTGPDVPVRPGSPGRAQPGRRIAVLDPDSLAGEPRELDVGEVGRLAVHRDDPGLMLGYWRRPEENAEVFRGDWFVTSDLAAIDADGYVTYHGRSDDVITAMGYRVSPVEVEDALAGVEGVAEVAVAALDVGDGVRLVCAWVVSTGAFPAYAADSSSESAADPSSESGPESAADPVHADPHAALRERVLARAAEQLAPYKRPREVRVVESLPRTANGKVVRRDLG